METSLKRSEKRRLRKRKKQRGLKLLKEIGQSPSRNPGIIQHVLRKDNSNRISELTKKCLQSVVQDLYNQRISFDSNLENFAICTNKPADETIDLCDGDSLAGSTNSSALVVPSVEVKPNNEIVIDLSRDLPNQDEVIDLTEASRSYCNDGDEATVIDITEEELQEQSSCGKSENDEILVIGTFRKKANQNKYPQSNSLFIPLTNTKNNFNNLVNCSENLKKKYLKKKSVLDKIYNKNFSQFNNNILKNKSLAKPKRVGENVYVNSPVTFPSSGLRPIIIDGSNVAFVHSNSNFSCKRLEICINYFKEKGHKVLAFVPQYRLNNNRSDNPELLRKLEKQGDVILTPSKKIDGRNIVPYDDRFIVQTAVLKGGIIVSRDNYNDLLKENPAWAETIKYRTLAFTWVDDVLMFPKDPLGEYGPSLEEFLQFH